MSYIICVIAGILIMAKFKSSVIRCLKEQVTELSIYNSEKTKMEWEKMNTLSAKMLSDKDVKIADLESEIKDYKDAGETLIMQNEDKGREIQSLRDTIMRQEITTGNLKYKIHGAKQTFDEMKEITNKVKMVGVK